MSALALLSGYLEWPQGLLLAVEFPLLVVALLIRRGRDRRRRLARLGDATTVRRLMPTSREPAIRWRALTLGGAALCAGIAVAGPRWGAERATVRASGADVAIAIDASLSMLAPDDRPSRLERAKEDVRRLRALAPGDRTALIAFAGRSYIMTPLTIDDGALALFLDNLDPSVVGQPGTSLARAIRQGTDLLLSTRTTSDRALVIMSDGEGFDAEEEVRAATARASDNGINVVAVGYGTERGSTIPLRTGDSATLKRDDAGAVVTTRYTPAMLRAVAEAGHGTFVPATATDKAANVRRALAKLRVVQRSVEQGENRTPRFQLFLIPALLLLGVDTLASDPRRRRRGVQRGRPMPAASLASGVLMALVLPGPPAQPRPGSRAGAYRHAIDAGDRRPRTLYNYGTALLAADSAEAAMSVLTRVADAPDPEVRYRAWFNLGLAHLERGLAASGDSAASDLDAALDAYKRVLLARPDDNDARWNYEVALRKRHGGGGGGNGRGGGGGGTSGAPPAPSAPPIPPAGALGQRQAEALLNSAAREERDVQSKVQRQNPSDVPPGGKDW